MEMKHTIKDPLVLRRSMSGFSVDNLYVGRAVQKLVSMEVAQGLLEALENLFEECIDEGWDPTEKYMIKAKEEIKAAK